MILNPGGKVLPNLDALAFGEQTSLPAEGRTDPAYYEAIADAIAQRTAEGGITLVPLSVTANGAYTPESGQAYSNVTVAVPTGGGLEILVTVTDEDGLPASGAVVTASKDGSTYTGVETATAGTYEISVPEYGTYTVTAVYDGQTKSKSVSLNETIGAFDFALPDGYTRLQFIESTGTQYINTGYRLQSDSCVEIDCMIVEYDSGSNITYLFGTNIPRTGANGIFTANSIPYFRVYYGNSSAYNDFSSQNLDRNVHTYNLQNKTYSINGNTYSFTHSVTTYALDMFLFAGNLNGTPSVPSKLRIYSLKWKENGEITHDLIPVVHLETGEAGLYDVITQTFLTNSSGSGSFIAGPEIS